MIENFLIRLDIWRLAIINIYMRAKVRRLVKRNAAAKAGYEASMQRLIAAGGARRAAEIAAETEAKLAPVRI